MYCVVLCLCLCLQRGTIELAVTGRLNLKFRLFCSCGDALVGGWVEALTGTAVGEDVRKLPLGL